MCGTPQVSRITCTSAASPGTLMVPSIAASDARARSSSDGFGCTTIDVNAAANMKTLRTIALLFVCRPYRGVLPYCDPPEPCLLLDQFLHLVHHAIHLPDRERQRLVGRHVDAGVLQQVDRVLRASGAEKREIPPGRRRIAGQDLLRQRRRCGERG